MAAGIIQDLVHPFINFENTEYFVRYSCLEAAQPKHKRGTVVFLHGFPNTEYQFRYVLDPVTSAGYDVIAPDWPIMKATAPIERIKHTLEKSYVAANVRGFLQSLNVVKPIHLVAHDMAAHVAIRLAIQSPIMISTLTWGEAIIPGTKVFQTLTDTGKLPWHFKFHALSDLPEQMIAGKEQVYIKHFFDTGCAKNTREKALSDQDLTIYARHMSDPETLQRDLAMYRTFPEDTIELKRILAEHGPSSLPVLIVNGGQGYIKNTAAGQARELHQQGTYDITVAEAAGHYVAEETPDELARLVLAFIAKHK